MIGRGAVARPRRELAADQQTRPRRELAAGEHTRPRREPLADERARPVSAMVLAELSHDLRAPLASLRLLVEGLSDGVLADERRSEYLAQMQTQVSLLTAMVNDLHSQSRVQASDAAARREPVDPRELIHRAAETMRIQAEARGVLLECAASTGLPVICANALQLHRVLVNLVENAIRHTEPGGSVTLRAKATFGGIEIEVQDDGDGIPEVDRKRVFQAFYGRDGEHSPARSGLGLAMAEAAVEAHGGRIWLGDSAGGTCVHIMLPASAPRRRRRRRGHTSLREF
jgi:two-component system sensor histidine kinase BaeS